MVCMKELSTEKLILEHLEEHGQKMSWLADKIGVTPGHLYHVLKGHKGIKRTLSEKNRKKINEILKTDY